MARGGGAWRSERDCKFVMLNATRLFSRAVKRMYVPFACDFKFRWNDKDEAGRRYFWSAQHCIWRVGFFL